MMFHATSAEPVETLYTNLKGGGIYAVWWGGMWDRAGPSASRELPQDPAPSMSAIT